jgi:hypothetical protein
MPKLTPEQSGWALTRIWLTAFEQAARDFHGTRPKNFCQRAYEYATEEWLNGLQNEYGITVKKAKSIKEAVNNYIEVGVQGGLFKDASMVEVNELNPNHVAVKVHSCRYIESCRDLVNKGVELQNMTCARIGCFRASVLLLANIECTYEVTSIHLSEGCEGFIERM